MELKLSLMALLLVFYGHIKGLYWVSVHLVLYFLLIDPHTHHFYANDCFLIRH